MKVANSEKQQYWRGHVAAVEKYFGSHEAYCRAEGISSSALKYWRRKVGKCRSGALAPMARFVPVEVTRERQPAGLPDPRWLAELIFHLSVGVK